MPRRWELESFDPDDFFSPHPAGLYFLMADGSVKFIKSSVNPNIYGDLASRNWGEVPEKYITGSALSPDESHIFITAPVSTYEPTQPGKVYYVSNPIFGKG